MQSTFFSSEAMQCWMVAQTLLPWLCSEADVSAGSWRNRVGLGKEHMRCCAQTARAAIHSLWGKDSEAHTSLFNFPGVSWAEVRAELRVLQKVNRFDPFLPHN